MAVCPRRGRRMSAGNQSLFSSQHGRRCPGLRCHGGSGNADETFYVLLVAGDIAGTMLRAGVKQSCRGHR